MMRVPRLDSDQLPAAPEGLAEVHPHVVAGDLHGPAVQIPAVEQLDPVLLAGVRAGGTPGLGRHAAARDQAEKEPGHRPAQTR